MFCIGLMLGILQKKHLVLMQLIFHHPVDVHVLCFRR